MNKSNIDNSIDVLSIPIAIVEYNSRILYNSFIVLENQLSQIDQTQEPDVYSKLDILTKSVFDSWITLGYRNGGGVGYELRD